MHKNLKLTLSWASTRHDLILKKSNLFSKYPIYSRRISIKILTIKILNLTFKNFTNPLTYFIKQKNISIVTIIKKLLINLLTNRWIFDRFFLFNLPRKDLKLRLAPQKMSKETNKYLKQQISYSVVGIYYVAACARGSLIHNLHRARWERILNSNFAPQPTTTLRLEKNIMEITFWLVSGTWK